MDLSRQEKYPQELQIKGMVVQDFAFDQKTAQLVKNEPPKPIGKVLHSENSNLTDRQPHFSRTPSNVEFKKKNPKTGAISSFERELGIPLSPLFLIFLFL